MIDRNFDLSDEHIKSELTPDMVEAITAGIDPVNDGSTESFISAAQELFKQEHQLPEPPRPPVTSAYENDLASNASIYNRSETKIIYDIEKSYPDLKYQPPSLEQQIESLETSKDYEKIFRERSEHHNRKRENFGQTYSVVAKYNLDAETIGSSIKRTGQRINGEPVDEPTKDPWKVVGLENRIALYRYLQHLGLVLVDDTGISANGRGEDHNSGVLFLPDEIDKETFYEFEDEVRSLFAFNNREILLSQLRFERDNDDSPKPEDLRVDEKLLREMVDSLSLDERFVGMFEKAEKIREARKIAPRVDLQAEVKIDAVEDSLDLLDFPELEI